MATVKIFTRGNSDSSALYIRFINGRKLDIQIKTNLVVNSEHWDNSKSNYRNVFAVSNRATLNARFNKLMAVVLESYNESYMLGEVIDKIWLENVLKEFFERPKQEEQASVKKHYVYYVDFVDWWLENISSTWRTDKNKFLNKRSKAQYQSFIELFKKYEHKSKQKIKIKEIDSFLINDFINVIIDKMNYAPATARRHVTRLKFFLNRAEKMDIKVNQNYRERVYVGNEEEDILAPYLNEEEIDRIFNLDLSSDDVLENIRDSFIISLWSGLRISDFNKNLNTENIDEDFINIKTTKTQAWVNIPLHSQVKQVLKKRFGYLPIRYSDKHFNDRIKTVCMLANIDEEIRGKKFDSDVKRKVIGTYKKYDLISSHTGRRSFATNLFGVVPNSVIMSVAGWSSEKVFLSYIKRTKKESALILKNVWDEKYK